MKIKWKTSQRGYIGDVEIKIRKRYKGAINYDVFVDGEPKGLVGLTIADTRAKAEEYFS